MNTPDFDHYCTACGVGLSSRDSFCSKCGAQVGISPVSMVQIQKTKDKTAAVLLAVFLGFWSWLYTFKASKAKFVFGLAVSLLGLLIAVLEQVSGQTTTLSAHFRYTIFFLWGRHHQQW